MLSVRGQQYSFSTHEWMFLWKCQLRYLNITVLCVFRGDYAVKRYEDS